MLSVLLLGSDVRLDCYQKLEVLKKKDLLKSLDYSEAQPRWPNMENRKPSLKMRRTNSVISLSPDLVGDGNSRKLWIFM